ncbi:MAG: MFS transporter [Kiloniellales bacterium]|nr:MFS transporter [Kiloniellales bacterium]
MADDPEDGPVRWREILTRRYGAALALVCLGVWLHAADSLLVATMLPAMVAEIGGHALVAWTIALYEIGSIAAGAASGLLALRHGVRLPMAAAAIIFALGCAISAVAPAMWVVLAGRVLQGLGGGGLMALSFVAVSLLFPQRLMPRAMAAISTLWGVSAFLGPLVGGLFVEFATWRNGFWFFALQAVALTAWIALGARLETRRTQAESVGAFPIRRLVLLSAGVVLIAYGGIEVVPLQTAAFVLAGIACLIVFLRLDAHRPESRLLPSNPFSLRTTTGSALAMILCFSIATIAITAYGPLLVTILHGTSALVAGYLVACSSIGWTIFAVLVSGAPERHDPRYIAAGMVMVTASIVGFAYAVPNGPIWLIAVFAVMEGGGFGLCWTFILRRATGLAPATETERISSAIPTVQRLGFALGAAYIGIVANAAGFAESAERSTLLTVASAVFIASLPLAGLGLVATGRFVSARKHASRVGVGCG